MRERKKMDYVYCTSSAEFSKQILVKVTLPQWLLIKVVCKFGTISQILLHLRVMPVEGVPLLL